MTEANQSVPSASLFPAHVVLPQLSMCCACAVRTFALVYFFLLLSFVAHLSHSSCCYCCGQDPERPGFIQCFDPCTLQHLGEIKAMDAADVEDVVQR